MDKANVRILFLLLIAVMFIGQAVYDFVKKNRSRTRHRRPAARPENRLPQTLNLTPHNNESDISAHPKDDVKILTEPKSDIEHIDDSHDINIADTVPPLSDTPDSDELRKAIIWSEILKRKF